MAFPSAPLKHPGDRISWSHTYASRQYRVVMTTVISVFMLGAITSILFMMKRLAGLHSLRGRKRRSTLQMPDIPVSGGEDASLRSRTTNDEHGQGCSFLHGYDVSSEIDDVCTNSGIPPCYCVAVDMPRPNGGSPHNLPHTYICHSPCENVTFSVDKDLRVGNQNGPASTLANMNASSGGCSTTGEDCLPSYEEAIKLITET